MNETTGGETAPSLAVLIEAMASWIARNRRMAALICAGAFLLSLFVTLAIPRDYVASMVVTPVESSLTDPSALMTTPGFSIRAPFSLSQGPPPQMAAFVKLLKSPEVARKLAENPQTLQAIEANSGSWLGTILHALTGGSGAPDEAAQIQQVLGWLTNHITVDQDVDVRTWTIKLRYPSSDGAVFLLKQVHAAAEDILRGAAITQFRKEKEFGLSFLNTATDAQDKQIIYGVLASIDRSLLVLRSGANVATIVISQPYASDRPSYPSRVMMFLIVLASTGFILFAALFVHCYRSILRGHRAANPKLAAAASGI